MLVIGVVGAGEASDRESGVAEEVGKAIAVAGHQLVCGGLGGVMEAASKGSKSQGGLTVGILPGERREEANPYIAVRIVTGMGHARNAIIARTSDALIAVGGGAGTLSEMALGLKMGRPVILLKGVMPSFPIESEGVHTAASAGEAVALVERLCRAGGCP